MSVLTIRSPGRAPKWSAWVYDKYVRDLTLNDLQTEARTERRGIWSLPESQQIPPWRWRRR